MQLTIVGGGGFRTPLVYQELIADPRRLIDRVVLVDTSPDRLEVIAAVLQGQAANASWAPRVVLADDLRAGLRGADFVFTAVRPGGLEGRVHDENIPLAHGVLGQETVGIGGILYGLRSLPAMREIGAAVAQVAPSAWLINFTNPAGMVTELLQSVLPGRVVGICDSPAALVRRACRALAVDERDADYDYVGLNHLGWLRSLRVDGADRLPELLADDALLAAFEEGELFGGDLLRALGTLPNEYLHYFYFADDVLDSLRSSTSRASFLREQQSRFYREAIAAASPRDLWERVVAERNRTYMAVSRDAAGAGERDEADVEGGGYERIALAVMRSIAVDAGERLILDVPNAGTLPDLDDDAVIEMPCTVRAGGLTPLPVAPLSDHEAGLMRQIKAVERWTIEAALTGSRDALHAAIATHPLTGSFPRAVRIVDEWLQHFPDVTLT
ncbi:6-phospho-beta-glucosidase [Blastococcus sp. Marseille-P5729]|uniref:family 4 glycosyl hydrolase n=1 Tax=Blastococcus sp. Marseille-P5729 TaxID=2086582 RepID=UPI000D0EB9D8|nr:6-phospho-beta-glucosidase [Blastococcus sp. Marseille-P5729]